MRKPRYKVQNAIYHVMSRANRQELIFDEKYKAMYLEVIYRAKKKFSFLFTDFCIMDNHPHLYIQPLGNEDVSKIMQWINSVFAIHYNKIMGYKGHVFYDRFKSVITNSLIQFLRTIFYIASNPARAGLVEHPLQWKFSSVTYRRKGLDPGLLDPHPPRIQEIIDNFLDNYPREKYCRKHERYSFFDRKPGRPKKVQH